MNRVKRREGGGDFVQGVLGTLNRVRNLIFLNGFFIDYNISKKSMKSRTDLVNSLFI